MSESTNISWCDHTHNHWIGCTRISPACDGCYAAHLMDTRLGRVEWGGPGAGAGTRALTSEANRRKPIAWNKKAERDGKRPFVFCSSLADVFDNQVPAEWRREMFDLIRATPRLVWLLLTKRPQLIVRLAEEAGGLPPNAALGATVEDQERADLNVKALLFARSAGLEPLFTFLSCEPLLAPLDLVTTHKRGPIGVGKIDWVITGGETDQGAHKARPTHPDWFRSLRDQCSAAGVPFHFKQWGEWCPGEAASRAQSHTELGAWWWADRWNFRAVTLRESEEMHADDEPIVWRVGKRAAGRTLDGVIHDAAPPV